MLLLASITARNGKSRRKRLPGVGLASVTFRRDPSSSRRPRLGMPSRAATSLDFAGINTARPTDVEFGALALQQAREERSAEPR